MSALTHLQKKTLLGGQSLKKFAYKLPLAKNAARDPADARPHMHQLAVSLPMMIKKEFNITVPTAARYDRLVKNETTGRFIGFNADCYYESSAI